MGLQAAFALSADEVRNAAPPGTIALIEKHAIRPGESAPDGSNRRIHLQPEPSSDPRDPLNLPTWRKMVILALMSLYAAVTNISSAILSSALPNLVTAFATFSPFGPPTGLIAFGDLTHLVAVNLLFLGLANVWWVPLSNTFGRRPIILLCMAMLCGFSVWCAQAQTFNSLLAARIFQGIGGAAADTLAPDVVGRIFFVHQRGRAMAVYTGFLSGGSLLGGIIGGYVTANLGWRWTMWLSAILAAAVLVPSLVLLPEVLFDRDQVVTDISRQEGKEGGFKVSTVEDIRTDRRHPTTSKALLGFAEPKAGFLRRLVQPYATFALPGVIMVMLHYAGLVGLVVTISTVAPQLLAAPPYLWGESVGLINVAGLVGAVLGGAYTYVSADWLTKRMARRESHGFAEPEDRLPLMFPALFIATAGALVFGFCAQNPAPGRWAGLAVGYGMVGFGLVQVPSIGFNYIIEAYGDWASDCFLIVVSARAIISFAWSFFVGTWSEERGTAEPFGIFALLMGLFGLTALPVWWYGKRLRIATENITLKVPRT